MASNYDTDSSNEETLDSRYQLKSSSRLTSQSRNLVINVLEYFTFGGLFKTSKEITKATAEATKLSERTIQRIKSERMKFPEGKIKSPPPRKRKSTVVDNLDNFERDCVRRELLAFYERGDILTLSSLLPKVKEPPINFSGALHKILKKLGFEYKKVTSGRMILMERKDIVIARKQIS